MTYYKQTDERWRYLSYYNGYPFGKYGCFVVSLSMMVDKEPPDTALILRNHNCFDAQGLLNSECAASALGLEYHGKSITRPDYPCIAETTYFAPGTPQHFFIINPDGSQLDPLGKSIKYPIKSYRLFKERKTIMTYPELVSAESTLSDSDKHRLALAWAFRSIYMKEPDQAKLDWLVAHYSDINVARQAMITEVAPGTACPPCDCTFQIKAEQDRIVDNFKDLITK